MHTSTVVVAVFDEAARRAADLVRERDLSVSWFSGTGKGGQNRNKVQASCRLLHVPTGIEAKAECRTREASFRSALDVINARVAAYHEERDRTRLDASRRAQTGSGQRGDKTRTYRLQADEVVDHRHGWRKRWTDVERGAF